MAHTPLPESIVIKVNDMWFPTVSDENGCHVRGRVILLDDVGQQGKTFTLMKGYLEDGALVFVTYRYYKYLERGG